MNRFSLSVNKKKSMPEAVRLDGMDYPINADYRNILRIFRMLNDKKLSEEKRLETVLRWFYVEDIPENGLSLMFGFIYPKEETANDSDGGEREQEKQFDYEYDAEEIYASFVAEYGIDLTEVPFLHWRKFRILMSNLSDGSACRRKIQLRFMDLRDYKGEAYIRMSEAKESVQLPVEYTAEELRDIAEFDDVWGNAGQ